MIAYFGVAPSIVWLSILIAAAFANGLPKRKRWLPALLIAAFVAAETISVQTVTPEETEPLPTEQSEAPEIPNIPEITETIELPEGFVPTKPQVEIPATILTPVAPFKNLTPL